MQQLTFEHVIKQLKKQENSENFLNNINVISGGLILFLGLNIPSANIDSFINALAIKDELINIGKNLVNSVMQRKSNEYDKRYEQIKWTYSMIYYTAYFDILDEKLPKKIRNRIALTSKERINMFYENRLLKLKSNKDDNVFREETKIFFPDYTTSYKDLREKLKLLYESITEKLIIFVHSLSFIETSSEKEIGEFNNLMKQMPMLAIKRFEAQYLYLASNFNEFYILMQIKSNDDLNLKMEENYKELFKIAVNNTEKIDTGLQQLKKIILNLPGKIEEIKIRNIVVCLKEKYIGEIEKPIIAIDEKNEKLKYPSIAEGFIPQSFKVLNYSNKIFLGDNTEWKSIKLNEDMESFFIKYFLNPFSFSNLLLILGEPGGGKSLLTKILAARLIDKNCIAIRIPLRNVNVDQSIEEIICEQIQNDGDSIDKIERFRWFSEYFKTSPITIIFDGYDEVLQTTGSIYRNFLQKINDFQIDCRDKHRPVRIIVTSRENLIDKAKIPLNTMVIKLMEFNEQRINKWIDIWNDCNKNLFISERINKFQLPINNSKILELSKQPLLLIMLAIYDANVDENKNELTHSKALNRTKLYDNLLRRFIKRELIKGQRGKELDFAELDENEKEKQINLEMERLSVVALGMYIRGKLSLSINELEVDLRYMEAKLLKYEERDYMLKQSELILGSFFFIHESKVKNFELDSNRKTFEFLHKTFYEFLVADFILKNLVKEIKKRDNLKSIEQIQKQFINQPDNVDRTLYIALMYTSICSEPEILIMMDEWKENVINKLYGTNRRSFDENYEELLYTQIKDMLYSSFIPSIWLENNNGVYKSKSYFQFCAMYSMNLIVCNIITSRSCQINFLEEDWSHLAYLWKMNIVDENILKFVDLFNIENKKGKIVISKKFLIDKFEEKDKIIQILDIANFIQDDIYYNMGKIYTSEIDFDTRQKCRLELYNKGIGNGFEIKLAYLYKYLIEDFANNDYNEDEVIDIIFSCLKIMEEGQKIEENLIINYLQYLSYIIIDKKETNLYYRIWQYNFVSNLAKSIIRNYPKEINYLMKIFNDIKNKNYDSSEIIEAILSDFNIVELLENDLLNEYITVLELFMSFGEIYNSISVLNYCVSRLEEYIEKKPEIVVRLIHVVSKYGDEHYIKKTVYSIVKNLATIIHEFPESIIEIIDFINNYGSVYIINNVIQIVLDNFKVFTQISKYCKFKLKGLIYCTGSENDVNYIKLFEDEGLKKLTKLDIAIMELIEKTGNIDFYKYYEYNSNEKMLKLLNSRPDFAINLLSIVNENGTKEDVLNFWDNIIKKYELILKNYPEIAIELLKELLKTKIKFKNYMTCLAMIVEDNFENLLIKNSNLALELIQMSINYIDKKDVINDAYLGFTNVYFEHVFNVFSVIVRKNPKAAIEFFKIMPSKYQIKCKDVIKLIFKKIKFFKELNPGYASELQKLAER